MKPILILILLSALLSSCMTRYESDTYTITVRDSIYREHVRNAPGSGSENGTVFPSSRTTRLSRESLSYDSTYERQYPLFLRYGGIEFAGLITGSQNLGLGAGLLGVYTVLDSNRINNVYHAKDNSIFKGQIFRVIPLEYRLHWFNEAPDWTIGWNAYENIAKDDDPSNSLRSVGANLYIRKRYWFRDKTPYLFASPFFGLSLAPSAYVNFGSELTFGSFGGFNLRAYAGIASGFTWGSGSKSITTPYLGLGVSALDFINKVSETEHEWKDYLHSAVEVSVFDIDLLDGFAGYPNLFNKSIASLPITGVGMQLATAHFPLDIWDGKFWAGTSLFKFFALGYYQAVMSVLPLRVGYRQYLIAEDLTAEPFLEVNYYPSSFVNLGGRLRLNTFHDMTVGLIVGYASGSTGAFYPRIFISQGSKVNSSINSFYVGISFSPKDRLNTPELVHALEKLVQW
ncbi:MAG: hypothetical protein Q8916_11660 [Bacteroidota bacterium]|nr:hypothetical protein [Bacteroidota bacterium]MDP4231046.1 hypothetical protein [Bacteroidota bacterium]MDP4234992.1 hypothetical protein [Bacteroidota bacterium]